MTAEHGLPRVGRRRLLIGGAATVAVLSTAGLAAGFRPRRPLPPAPGPASPTTRKVTLTAAERPTRLLGPDHPASPLWTYGEQPLTVIRARRGDTLETRLENRLPEHTSVHWHGLRIPNAMDGVPYITQPPVGTGEHFDYRFVLPDTGTFFFHPHCDTVQQVGRGLAGVLVVEGDAPVPYAADVLCLLKDWRLDESTGRFLDFLTDSGAAKAGTFGTVRSTNFEATPTVRVPAGRDVRVRILNLDVTRVSQVGVMGAEAAVIAVDGNAVSPFPLTAWRMGPAMRLDVAVRAPAPGSTATVVDYFAKDPVPLMTLVGDGEMPASPGDFDPAPLYAPTLPEPDLRDAEALPFTFSSTAVNQTVKTPDGGVIDLSRELCLNTATYWAINRQTWPERGHELPPPPLAELTQGRSYVFELRNVTPHMHPIHLHGHTFKVLESNKVDRPVHWADTVLLTPKERVRIAFVADNPGRWMFHCHIIEHQDTGMMGYVTVA
ncbi:multicopper oxidase family protein [Thalassobaculum fulvum]|uniref:multicopper oxidase family protein n=1 Tax=Thalassobaculum fulvum TaxID=1633335 RepID=UPI001679F688|nr:multicopper oxidase family protein [Thalassobaculum fulvum]